MKILSNKLSKALMMLFIAVSLSGFALAGASGWEIKWETAKVFIENKGQFPTANRDKIKSSEVLFAYDNGQTMIYFSKKGVTYAFNKKTKAEQDADEKDGEENENKATTETDIIPMVWENANPDVKVVASEPTTDYFSYGMTSGSDFKMVSGAKGYHTLRYNDLYPGIDVVYVFSNDDGGFENKELKYSIILHPGADASLIRMKYPEDRNVFLRGCFGRNLYVKTAFDFDRFRDGCIIETHPKSYYADNIDSIIYSRFRQEDGNTISFSLEDYDHAKTVIIDPWSISPTFNNSNKIWECERDTVGNVYLYGGDMPMTLRKYNANGILQWTYSSPWDTATYWVGTMICDKGGNCYITSGSNGEISKINPAGGLVWHNNPNGFFGPLFEYWHLALNCDQTQLIVGGERMSNPLNITGARGAIMNLNMASGAVLSYVEVGYMVFPKIKEVRAMCSSSNGNFYYLTLDSIGCINPALAVQYQVSSTYNFSYGIPNFGVTNQGINAMRATYDFIYTQNGTTVSKRNINTGAIITTVNIPGGVSTQVFFTNDYTPGNSGIDIDSCGNVYVGSTNGLVKYDANLNWINTHTTVGAVYDVVVTGNGEVVVCGDHFAQSIDMAACAPIKIVCSNCPILNMPVTNHVNDSCYGQSNGSFSINTTNGTGPFGYVLRDSINALIATYSNVSTVQNFTNLPAGTYTLTTTDANGCTGTITIIITQPPAIVASITGQSSVCNGGADTLTATNGFATYHWSNGATTQSTIVSTSGYYSVTVTDASSGGCSAIAGITITINPGANAAFTVDSLSGCAPLTCTFNNTSTGATSYHWDFGDLGTSTAPNPVHTYTASGNYSVTLIAYSPNGCNDTTILNFINVAGPASVHASFTVDTLSGCKPLLVHFTNTSVGATSYWWHFSDGGTSTLFNPVHSYSHSGTYSITLVAYDTTSCGIFMDTMIQTFYYTVFQPPSIPVITIHGDTLISNFSTGNQWYDYTTTIPGATNQQFIVAGTGCYSVLETDSNGCTSHSDTVCFLFAGINELLEGDGISIFPNPNSGSFTVKVMLQKAEAIRIKVMDVLGQTIYDSKTQTIGGMFSKDIKLEAAPDGIYFIGITIGDQTVNRKLMIGN